MLRAQALERLEPAHARHRDVEYDHVGRVLLDLLEHLAAVRSLRDDAKSFLGLEQPAQTFPHDAVVVGDQNGGHVERRVRLRCRRGKRLAVRAIGFPSAGALW
jgi:hypothetical protein